jgi:hypothetical protein
MLVARANQKARDDLRSSLTAMPWHARKPDPVVRDSHAERSAGHRLSSDLYSARQNVAKLFRARDFDNARAALKAARSWCDGMTKSLLPLDKAVVQPASS